MRDSCSGRRQDYSFRFSCALRYHGAPDAQGSDICNQQPPLLTRRRLPQADYRPMCSRNDAVCWQRNQGGRADMAPLVPAQNVCGAATQPRGHAALRPCRPMRCCRHWMSRYAQQLQPLFRPSSPPTRHFNFRVLGRSHQACYPSNEQRILVCQLTSQRTHDFNPHSSRLSKCFFSMRRWYALG